MSEAENVQGQEPKKHRRAAPRGYWLYRTHREDGTPHPRIRFRYRGADGRMKHATGYTDKTETERLARRLAIEADEIRRGIRKPATVADTESLKPITDHIAAYLALGRTQGGRDGRPWADSHERNIDRDLGWWVETLKLATLHDVSLPAVEKALQEKAAKDGVTGKTLSNIVGALAGFVGWCVDRKYLASDPLDGLREFDTSVSIENYRRAATLAEVGELLAATPEPRKLVYRVALVTGFRASEIKSLKVGDVDFEKKTVCLHAENAKDRRAASCALPDDLAEALARHVTGRPAEAEVFPDFDPAHAARTLNRDLAAGIEKRTFTGKLDFHALRTTHVNLGVELGFDVKTAQALARHKDPRLTMNVYGRANAERLRGAVESIYRAIEKTETASGSRREVERGALALAAGAETAPQPLGVQKDDDGNLFGQVAGSSPVTLATCRNTPSPDKPATTHDTLNAKGLHVSSELARSGASICDTHSGPLRVSEQVERKSNGDPDFDRLAALWPKLLVGGPTQLPNAAWLQLKGSDAAIRTCSPKDDRDREGHSPRSLWR